MAIVFGASGGSGLDWSGARAKVRGDLWRPGTSGVPDDVVDRALHASLQELEGERRWLWLENVLAELTLDHDADFVDLPGSVRSVTSISYTGTGYSDPLTPAPLNRVRELARGTAGGSPRFYAFADRRLYFDTRLTAGSAFEMIFTAGCPQSLADAIVSPSITLARHQQAVIALACHYVALTYLKNEADAARQLAGYGRHLDRLMDTEDQQRGDTVGGSILPDNSLFAAAHGRC